VSPAILPGALRRRVTIEVPADAPDAAGGVTRAFAPLAQVCAAVEPVSAAEAEQGRAAGLRRL